MSGMNLFFACAIAICLIPTAATFAWDVGPIELPADRSHPLVAATDAEVARLRDAWRADNAVITGFVKNAESGMVRPIDYPPRGGQHNQWYQCDACQVALQTVDATHHQCPRCDKVYSGEPYDDVLFARQHSRNLGRAEQAAWAYIITGEPKYADYARDVLMGYADRYRDYPFHSNYQKDDSYGRKSGGHLYEQTLNEAATITTQIGPTYDLIHDALSDEQRQHIKDNLIVPMLENIGKYRAGKSNWQTWHNAAFIVGGAAIEDVSWVRRAIVDDGNGFVDQMDISVTPDGMWYENSWGYHFYTLSAMVEIVEAARRLDIDLWSHPRFKPMFTLALDYAMADGTLPRFGDDVNSRVSSATSYLEYAYNAYRDESMLGYLPDRESFTTILFGRDVEPLDAPIPTDSTVFHGAGHAILRTQGDAGLTAAMTFGPYGGYHGHYDKLSFVFFGYGRELGVDPGRAASQAYRLPVHKLWYKTSISHNTVLQDGHTQLPAEGKLRLFEANEQFAAALASCDRAYPGTDHQRLLVMTPEYLLVVDQLQSSESHRFDWLYHNRGNAMHANVERQPVEPHDEPAGFEFIEDRAAGVSDEMVRVRFVDDGVTTHVTLAPQANTRVMTGTGVGASMTDRVPMTMISREGQAVRFVAVIEPLQGDAASKLTNLTAVTRSGTLTIRVERDGITDIVAIPSPGRIAVQRNGRIVLVKQ
jgi:hypothetical protein